MISHDHGTTLHIVCHMISHDHGTTLRIVCHMISHDHSTTLRIGVVHTVPFLCTATRARCVYRESHVLCTSFADAVSYSGKVGFVSSKGRDIVLYMYMYICVHWTCGKGEEGNNASEPLCLTYIYVYVYTVLCGVCVL